MRAHGTRLRRERKRERTNVQFAWLSFAAGINHDDEVYRRHLPDRLTDALESLLNFFHYLFYNLAPCVLHF